MGEQRFLVELKLYKQLADHVMQLGRDATTAAVAAATAAAAAAAVTNAAATAHSLALNLPIPANVLPEPVPDPRYAHYMSDEDFWAAYALELPDWFLASKEISLITPNSASCERLFSHLSGSFNDNQQNALQDYKLATAMLRYNKL
jgi:hypothetical protein